MRMLFATTAYDAALMGNRIHEEFLQHWIALGHAATVFTPSAQHGTGRWIVEDGPIPVVRAPVRSSRVVRGLNWASKHSVHYDYFANTLRTYLHYLRSHPEYDVVHVESVYPFGAIAALASLFDRRPFIATIRGGDLMSDDVIGYGYARFRSVRALLRLTFKRASAIRSLSPITDAQARSFGCPDAKLVVVPRHILDEYFLADPAAFRLQQRAWLRAQYPHIAARRVIVAAGRLLPIKGFDDLVRAMVAVPDATALICGPNRHDEQVGDYADYLLTLAAQHGVADRILLVGEVAPSMVKQYLAGADLVAVPSLMEGSSKTLVEGAALGIPFVTTTTTGNASYFSVEHGLTVPPRQPDLFGTALAQLLAEDQAASTARQAACTQAAERFRTRHVTQELARVYEQFVAARAR